MKCKRVAVLGSTGSIGRQTLDVIRQQPGLCACALGAGSNWQLLAAQVREHRPQIVAMADEAAGERLRSGLPEGTRLLTGQGATAELVRASEPDVLLAGMVGTAGLGAILAGIECRATLALANKEALAMAGAVILPAAHRAGVAVVPVDSEHSAIFQCLACGRRADVRRVTITASGGAFRDWDADAAANATVQQALNHPTWAMGPKVTVDSATLINKALELLEAHWLFGLSAEQLSVVLHAESVVHSYVEYCDGSVIAQLAPPDMKVPIAYALCYPDRPRRSARSLDLTELGTLTFSAPAGRFARAVEMGYEAIRREGLAGAVLNGANEAAVRAFLDGHINFGRIVPLVEEVLSRTPAVEDPAAPTLQALIDADAWARQEVCRELVGTRTDPAAVEQA